MLQQINNNNTNIIHLSDSDLDGYGCQYFLNKYNTNNKINQKLEFHNSIPSTRKEQIDIIKEKILSEPNKTYLILITDISLEIDLADDIDLFIKNNSNVKLQLIDHHISGLESSKKYNWYYLNTQKSAAYLTYNWLKDQFGELENNKEIAEIINISDNYISSVENFEKIKILSSIIWNKINYPNNLSEFKREHVFYIIEEIGSLIISDLDTLEIEISYLIKEKEYLLKKIENKEIKKNHGLSTESLFIYYIYELFFKKELDFTYINVNNVKYKTIVFFDLSNIFQDLSNYILKEHNEIDIFMNVNQNGSFSLRTNNQKIDLNDISQHYFKGGGHKKSAGGKIDFNFKTKLELLKKIKKIFAKKMLSKKYSNYKKLGI